MAVEQIFEEQGLQTKSVRLGEVELTAPPAQQALELLSKNLSRVGFELLDDQKSRQIEQIKTLIIQKVQGGDIEEHFSISKYLGEQIFRDYSSLSKLFSEVEGITIEQFLILQKIEKAKEWLVYNEQSLGEIALNLGYSSPQHLSSQFRKLTGMTPSQFKKMGALHRKPLDEVGGRTQ